MAGKEEKNINKALSQGERDIQKQLTQGEAAFTRQVRQRRRIAEQTNRDLNKKVRLQDQNLSHSVARGTGQFGQRQRGLNARLKSGEQGVNKQLRAGESGLRASTDALAGSVRDYMRQQLTAVEKSSRALDQKISLLVRGELEDSTRPANSKPTFGVEHIRNRQRPTDREEFTRTQLHLAYIFDKEHNEGNPESLDNTVAMLSFIDLDKVWRAFKDRELETQDTKYITFNYQNGSTLKLLCYMLDIGEDLTPTDQDPTPPYTVYIARRESKIRQQKESWATTFLGYEVGIARLVSTRSGEQVYVPSITPDWKYPDNPYKDTIVVYTTKSESPGWMNTARQDYFTYNVKPQDAMLLNVLTASISSAIGHDQQA
jgi:hypothetical protein